VVAQKFVGEGGQLGQAPSPPIPPPLDQQLYSSRTPTFPPGMPGTPASGFAEDFGHAGLPESPCRILGSGGGRAGRSWPAVPITLATHSTNCIAANGSRDQLAQG
jgi:hypothetical protein